MPTFYAAHDPDWRRFNAELVARYKLPTLAQTVEAARISQRARVDALEALPEGDVSRDFGVRSPRNRRVTIAMLLAAEIQDERAHAAQIRAFAVREKTGLAAWTIAISPAWPM